MTDSQRHQSACPRCKARLWCITVMNLIARKDGFLSWEMKLATILAAQRKAAA